MNGIENEIKNDIRELVEIVINARITLTVASIFELVLERYGDCKSFLVNYHVEKTAESALDLPIAPPVDVELEREILEHAAAEFAAMDKDTINLYAVVGRVFTAHSRSGTRFRGPIFDPDWHATYAFAGMKHLIIDVLAEDWWPGELQKAYVIAREGEAMIVPSSGLTVAEETAIVEEDQKIADEYNAELQKILDEKKLHKEGNDPNDPTIEGI